MRKERSEKKENDVFKSRVLEAFKSKEFIKIIFQYPASERAIIKRGYVTQVFDNGFLLDEIVDGNVSYSYNFIAEIRGEEKRENGERSR